MTEPRPPSTGDSEESALATATAAVLRPMRNLVALVRPSDQPLELQILGRTLLHAALVGFGAGIIGVLFFLGAERLQVVLLEQLAGYEPLRARGEEVWTATPSHGLRWWLLPLIPAIGALIGGLLTRYAPECAGSGAGATIQAFHHDNGVMRRRVLWVKPLASIVTLGSGGSGGREGPTMHIGGALGSTVARYLHVTARERRVLMVAGVAAGIAAVFRTPLGAALVAIEMLYRDDFESEALIPAVLASVVAYSVSISVFGQATLFGHLSPHTFHPRHLPLYVLLAIVIAAGASVFVASLQLAKRISMRLPVPAWLRPAIGGLVLGVFVTLLLVFVGPLLGRGERGLGVLGGGYGAAQIAITGADWLPTTWQGVQILVVLGLAKIVATSASIGFGGSVGSFAPSLATGALLGGAFGLAARLLLDDPAIDPGAFALVGMGAFYGGIANTPLAALVLVSEMAGSYDLLVPLMLAEGVAFIALRRVSLHPEQVPTVRESPVHQRERDRLRTLRCGDVVRKDRVVLTATPEMTIAAFAEAVEQAADQDVFPIVDDAGALRGLTAAEALRIVASNPELQRVAVVADLMVPPASVAADADLRTAAELMIARDLRSVPVLDEHGRILGLLDEHQIAGAMLA